MPTPPWGSTVFELIFGKGKAATHGRVVMMVRAEDNESNNYLVCQWFSRQARNFTLWCEAKSEYNKGITYMMFYNSEREQTQERQTNFKDRGRDQLKERLSGLQFELTRLLMRQARISISPNSLLNLYTGWTRSKQFSLKDFRNSLNLFLC